MPLLRLTDCGLYCEAGDFYIDPWRPVDAAVVTHGHSDHSRYGMKKYLATRQSEPIMRRRLGTDINLQTLEYGERVVRNGVQISLHPAGHIVGSAQVRVEHQGEVWVVTGDYKREVDQTAGEFELVKCHGLVTETTFGLPVYQWMPEAQVFDEINRWWADNQKVGRTSVVLAYALGKAQRVLAGVDATQGPIVVHGAVAGMNEACREGGVALPDCLMVKDLPKDFDYGKALVVAPPSAGGSTWLRRFRNPNVAFASGWMMIRGVRRRRSVDKGFVLSDHVDWNALMTTVKETGAETVWTTHGYADTVARYLRETLGLNSEPLRTEFGEEDGE